MNYYIRFPKAGKGPKGHRKENNTTHFIVRPFLLFDPFKKECHSILIENNLI